jgi:hypothetical protein
MLDLYIIRGTLGHTYDKIGMLTQRCPYRCRNGERKGFCKLCDYVILPSAIALLMSSQLTGASGFLGSQVVAQALKSGFAIKAAFRTEDKSSAFRDAFPGQDIQTVQIRDITAPGAYNGHLAGCCYVVHCASPFTFEVGDIQRDLIDPAVKGTKELLKAIASTPSVKRWVMTSSFAAVVNPFVGPRVGYSYTGMMD